MDLHLKRAKPKSWWNEVTQIVGMVPVSGTDDLCNQLHLNNMENMRRPNIANLINNAFLEPVKTLNSLTTLPTFTINNYFPQLDILEVLHLLKALSPGKASGPDNIPNRFLREYAEILAQTVCKILNSSYAEQQPPKSWKFAYIVPLIKTKPVDDTCQQILLLLLFQKLQRTVLLQSTSPR